MLFSNKHSLTPIIAILLSGAAFADDYMVQPLDSRPSSFDFKYYIGASAGGSIPRTNITETNAYLVKIFSAATTTLNPKVSKEYQVNKGMPLLSVFAGYKVNQTSGFEAGISSLSKYTYEPTFEGQTNPTTYTVNLIAPFANLVASASIADGISVSGKIGVMYSRSEEKFDLKGASQQPATIVSWTPAPQASIGLSYEVTDEVSVNSEIQYVYRPFGSNKLLKDLAIFNVSTQYKFGLN